MALRTHLITLTTLGALLCSAAALAETGGDRHRSHGAHGRHHGGLFARMDKNGDGKIERSEARTAATEFFAKLDANKDGKITPDEQSALSRATPDEGRRDAHFARMDENGDGKIDRQETRMPEEHFVRADADKDGKLTKREMKAAFEALVAARKKEHFAEFDANKDGKIDTAEAVAHADQRFAKLDANKDGQVTRQEAKQGLGAMKHGKRGQHGCDGAGEKTTAPSSSTSPKRGQAI